MGHRRHAISIVIVLAAVRAAAADIDNVKAEALFNEAVALREHDPAQACVKFELSLAANPQAIGTLLNVALCDEATGRIASAVTKLKEVADRAREQGNGDYVHVAEDRLAVLTPDVPYLAITFAEPPLPETKVLVDEHVVLLENLGKLAIDPGERVIVVTAPGRVAFRKTLMFVKHTNQQLEIPALTRSVIKSSRRTIGKITLIAGVATTGTGIALALVARSRYNEPFDSGACDRETRVCTGDGGSKVQAALTLGNVGTAVTIVGIGATVVGAYLWLRTPAGSSERRGKVSVLPHVDRDGAGVVAIGRF